MNLIKTLSLLTTCMLIVLQISHAAYDIGNRKQLFIDHKFIEESEGVTLQMNPPVKHGKVMPGTNSWENGIISGAGTLIEDGGKYRLWYTAMPASNLLIDDVKFRLCYAESEDGINWEKPNLGLYEWKGSKANNIIMETKVENGGGVFLDPTAPPDERYKLLALMSAKREKRPHGKAPDGDGLYIYTSPDGLHWKLHPKNMFPFHSDTVNMALYDDRTDKYLAFVRTWAPMRRVGVVETGNIMKPWPYDRSIKPSDRWSPDDTPPPSYEIPDAFGVDEEDPEELDHYTSAVVKYPWADDAYFMFPSAYLHFPNPPEGKFRNDGPLDLQMAVSRDGRKYHLVSRFPYIELGIKGAADSGAHYMYIGMLRSGDKVYQYYGGYDYTHGAYKGFPETKHRGGMFMTSQRLDGFISADVDHTGGSLITPAVIFEGKRLVLNMNASATGEVLVELRDENGQPIEGFSFEDADSLYMNDVAKTVTWRKGETDVSSLAGKPVQIAFKLRSVKLYGFQFTD